MTEHKTLRDQVAEAIVAALEVRSPHSIKSITTFDMTGLDNAADAAIKAVLEGLRCDTCKCWRTDEVFGYKHCSESVIEYPLDNFGCTRWRQK